MPKITKEEIEANSRPAPFLDQFEGLIARLIKTNPDPSEARWEVQNKMSFRPELFPEERVEDLWREEDPDRIARMIVTENDPGKVEFLVDQYQELRGKQSPIEMMELIPTMEHFLARL